MSFLLFGLRGKENGTKLGIFEVLRNACLVDLNYPIDELGYFNLYWNY
jgi:hypothetical protein